MAYVPGFKHDLFLSYAHAESDWVENFRVALAQALHYLIGRAPAVWHDVRNIRFGQDWPDEVQKGIRDAAAFLAVCSPSYFNSAWCAREYETFAPDGSLEGLKVGSFFRFLKIIKTPDPEQIHTRFFRDLEPIRFFNRSEEEYLRGSPEFMFEVGRAAKAIFELLRQMRNSKQALYVATTVPGLNKEWQQLRDQLVDYGYDVRPTVVLTPAIEGLVEEELDRSMLAVFLLDGSENAFVPERLGPHGQHYIDGRGKGIGGLEQRHDKQLGLCAAIGLLFAKPKEFFKLVHHQQQSFAGSEVSTGNRLNESEARAAQLRGFHVLRLQRFREVCHGRVAGLHHRDAPLRGVAREEAAVESGHESRADERGFAAARRADHGQKPVDRQAAEDLFGVALPAIKEKRFVRLKAAQPRVG